jgi:hypothetical protein
MRYFPSVGRAAVSNVQNAFRIPRANDRAIIEFFEEMLNALAFAPPHVQLYGEDRSYERNGAADLFERLTAKKGYSIVRAHARNDIVTVKFHRGIFEPVANSSGGAWKNSPAWDTIELSPVSNQQQAPLELVAVIELINERLGRHTAKLAAGDDTSRTDATLSSHLAMVEKLQQALTDMAERHGAQQAQLQEDYDQRRQKLIEETDALRISTVAELDSERQSVAVQRQELDQRTKELDDRQNTHVRRDIRRELKAQLGEYKSAFALTKGTTQLRTPIHVAAITIVVLLLVGIVFFAVQPSPSDGWAYLLFLAKPLGLTFFAVAIATWYVNWMNRWFERHADVEFRLKELELDIDRASWLVETAFEWKKSGEDAMPDKMLDAIGRNLFVGRDETPAAGLNPVDQLASALLGQAANAKINIAGHQLEFDRKALRQAGKEA